MFELEVIAWSMVVVWGLLLLGTARPPMAPLPLPSRYMPEYLLWLPQGGAAPTLDPPPAAVHTGARPPESGPRWMLVLGAEVEPSPDLPRRLYACGRAFVSVFPRPRGGLVSLAIERLRRDFAGPVRVNDVTHPAGFADERCVWMRRDDLSLPGVGEGPGLRVARARKAHLLAVDLRSPEGALSGGQVGPTCLRVKAMPLEAHQRTYRELIADDQVLWALMAVMPPLMVALTLLPLMEPAAHLTVALAVALGSVARLHVALRDGFGLPLAIAGWWLEPWLALQSLKSRPPSPTPLPDLPARPAPRLTGGRERVPGARWMDRAGVPFLARRLGGSATVMEAIYANEPKGTGWLGATIDRVVLSSSGARAVRHRWWAVVQRGRRRAPLSVLSVPAGGGRDAAALGAERLVLVDPDASARALSAAAAPSAQVVDAMVESAPAGPFDLILYVGLIEYLDDEKVVHHLAHLRGRLAPGGALIVTTTEPHKELPRMAQRLGWHTRGRTSQALLALLDDGGLVAEDVHTDPLGIQTVVVAVPRGG